MMSSLTSGADIITTLIEIVQRLVLVESSIADTHGRARRIARARFRLVRDGTSVRQQRIGARHVPKCRVSNS